MNGVVGVISDTHGLMRREALEALAGSELIYVLHDLKTLEIDPETAKVGVVVSGHSHRPGKELRGGVLYFNPGSAGPRRFRLPIAVGRLTVKRGGVESELVLIDG